MDENKSEYRRVMRLPFDRQAALEYYNRGMTDKEIADNCGVKVKTIAAWRRSMGFLANAQSSAKKQEQSPLVRDTIAARKLGMTYGQYKAQQYKAAHPWKGGKK